MTLSSKMDSQLDKNNMNLYKCQLMYQKYTNLQHQMDSLHNCMMNTIAAWNTCKLPNNECLVQVDNQVKEWLDNIDKITTEDLVSYYDNIQGKYSHSTLANKFLDFIEGE